MAAVALGLLSVTSEALALWDDQLQLFVAESVTSDSNVFRIAKERDAQAFLGTPKRSDTYTTTTLGFNLDVPVSRQRFQLGSTWNQTRYNRFSDLNYLSRDSRATWLWQAGNDWSGQLGYIETDTLASFSNIQGRTANPLTTRKAYGNAAYLLTPSWQLLAGVAQTEQRNSNAVRRENDIDLQTIDLGVNYITRADNKFGVALRQDEGRYPNRQLIGGFLVDNQYTQRGVGLVADWTISAKSHLKARIDRVQRDYEQLTQRNYDGTIYNATYDWQATAKVKLSALAQKDISSGEDLQTSFVLIKGGALRASYDMSEKINVSANVAYNTRDYLGDPGLALGTAGERIDKVHLLNAMVSYRPMRSLTLQLSGQRETRSSNIPLGDYTANIVNFNARLAF